MTTQIPYDPGSAPPMPEYPAAAPWAPPEPPAETAPDGRWDGTPHTRHGQLMVPYPELMHGAGRPSPPTWLPVALVSLFLAVTGGIGAAALTTNYRGPIAGVIAGAAGGALGLLGATVAARRARQARRHGNPRYPYWLAFGLTLVAAAVPGLYAVGVTASVVQSQIVEPRAERTIEQSLVGSGRVSLPTGVTVRSARCSPIAARRTSDGLRDYLCSVSLSSGRVGTVQVAADRRGHWTSVATR
jgi:hypothetical protein